MISNLVRRVRWSYFSKVAFVLSGLQDRITKDLTQIPYLEQYIMAVSKRRIQNEIRYVKSKIQPLLDEYHHPLTKKFLRLYLYEQLTHIEEKGEPIEGYNRYNLELTDQYFEEYDDANKTIRQIAVELLSDLIFLQTLPNANHRTAINFVALFLEINSVFIKNYSDNEIIFNEYVLKSNDIIKHDLVRELEKKKYFMNEELEKETEKEYQRKHLEMTDEYFDKLIQSGKPQVMPLKRLRALFSDSENP